MGDLPSPLFLLILLVYSMNLTTASEKINVVVTKDPIPHSLLAAQSGLLFQKIMVGLDLLFFTFNPEIFFLALLFII